MPSGNDDAASRAIYDALTAHALNAIPAPRTVIAWDGPTYIVVFAAVLIGFFFAYSLWLQHHTRQRGEVTGVISFGGYILERIGSIGPFDWLVWGGITLWALWIILDHVLNGQYYI